MKSAFIFLTLLPTLINASCYLNENGEKVCKDVPTYVYVILIVGIVLIIASCLLFHIYSQLSRQASLKEKNELEASLLQKIKQNDV